MTGRGRPRNKVPKRSNGEGSVYWDASKGKFRASIALADPLTGKKRRVSRLASTEQDAHKLIESMRAEAEAETTATMPTLAEWAEQWTGTVLAQRAPKTQSTAKASIKKWITTHTIGTYLLDRVTPDHVDSWMQEMATGGRALDTIKQNRKHLNQMMQWAVKRGRITSNPVTLAELPRTEKEPREHVTFTHAEAIKFAEACQQPDEPWGPFFLLCAMTGMRPGEALALQWSDINEDARTIHIRRAVVRDGDKCLGIGPTKKKDQRIIRVSEVERRLLDRQRCNRAAPADASLADHVFLTPSTGRVSPQANVRKQLNRVCWDAGVRRLTPYDLRHSCASLLLAEGIAAGDVAMRLGTSIRMLDRHYHHLIGEVHQAGSSVIADIYGAA